MSAAAVHELTTVSLTLAIGTLVSMAATMLNRTASAHVMWFALTFAQGIGFLASLLILFQAVQS